MSKVSKDRVSRINLGLTERGALAAASAALITTAVVKRGPAWRALLGTAAGLLAYKAVTGHSAVYRLMGIRPAHFGRHREQGPLYVTHTLTIGRSPAELYSEWRDFANLPSIFTRLCEVKVLDDRRSHWTVEAVGQTFEWDSEITLDLPDREIRWQSSAGDVPNRGIVRFEPAPGDRGTMLRVQMMYEPPAGKLGAVVARLWGDDPHVQLQQDLRCWKQRLETGEVPTTKGQPSGRSPPPAPGHLPSR